MECVSFNFPVVLPWIVLSENFVAVAVQLLQCVHCGNWQCACVCVCVCLFGFFCFVHVVIVVIVVLPVSSWFSIISYVLLRESLYAMVLCIWWIWWNLNIHINTFFRLVFVAVVCVCVCLWAFFVAIFIWNASFIFRAAAVHTIFTIIR